MVPVLLQTGPEVTSRCLHPLRVESSEPGARAARGSSLLGKGPGQLLLAVVAAVSRRGRAFLGAAAARVVGGAGRRM
jgi:hypothetical protein